MYQLQQEKMSLAASFIFKSDWCQSESTNKNLRKSDFKIFELNETDNTKDPEDIETKAIPNEEQFSNVLDNLNVTSAKNILSKGAPEET